MLEPYVRSMSFFKPYAEFKSDDFYPVTSEMKLVKVRAGQRITSYGDPADHIYVIISGRIAVCHPNAHYMKLLNDIDPKAFKERTQMMSQKDVEKVMR